ncbi:MAG: histidine--tRNA ligase [archaeon]|nr:histidine--tRNA ligase [archaeon]
MNFQTAKGVRDLPPEEKILKNQVVDTIRKTFELSGFSPLETPTIERYETLAAKFGAGADSDALKETFMLEDQGGRKLGLRFEMTTSLARYVAMNPTIKMPFKSSQIGPVFRDGPIKLGREREFWQCDVDVVGSRSMMAEVELISILTSVFRELEIPFIIKINNRKILNGILNQAGIKDVKGALIALDKLDKIGQVGVEKEMRDKGYTPSQIKKLFSFISDKTTLSSIKKNLTDEGGKEGIRELEIILNYLKLLKIKEIDFDVSLARGQAYYTGTVIEAYATKSTVNSSIAGGGRYDQMIGNFVGGNREIPAVGVSFGLTPLMEVLKNKTPLTKKTVAKVLVLPINTEEKSILIAQELREKGISVDFALISKGVSKNLEYANSLGISKVLIIGENELKKNKVLLRDMVSGTEQLLSLAQAVKKLQ